MTEFTISPDVLAMKAPEGFRFPAAPREFLRIKSDGTIEIAEGLSMEDATREAAKLLVEAHGRAVALRTEAERKALLASVETAYVVVSYDDADWGDAHTWVAGVFWSGPQAEAAIAAAGERRRAWIEWAQARDGFNGSVFIPAHGGDPVHFTKEDWLAANPEPPFESAARSLIVRCTPGTWRAWPEPASPLSLGKEST